MAVLCTYLPKIYRGGPELHRFPSFEILKGCLKVLVHTTYLSFCIILFQKLRTTQRQQNASALLCNSAKVLGGPLTHPLPPSSDGPVIHHSYVMHSALYTRLISHRAPNSELLLFQI